MKEKNPLDMVEEATKDIAKGILGGFVKDQKDHSDNIRVSSMEAVEDYVRKTLQNEEREEHVWVLMTMLLVTHWKSMGFLLPLEIPDEEGRMH